MWQKMKRWFSAGDSGGPAPSEPEYPRIPPEQNPWGISLLDLRPLTQSVVSASQNAECASNALSYGSDDGTSFIGQTPPVDRTTPSTLRYRVEGPLVDGLLFRPDCMEHKWAIYYRQGQILCIRSWTRQVLLTADVQVTEKEARITQFTGSFSEGEEDPAYTERLLDFLIRTHAMNQVYPVPLMEGMEETPHVAAVWSFAAFGNIAWVGTEQVLPLDPPKDPLRTNTFLHIAAARGEIEAMRVQLELGVPFDTFSQDGMTPLHWALASTASAPAKFLIEAGCPVDVRSVEGATPLMNAVQGGNTNHVRLLIEHGANVNAMDYRGFTALHRAAEMGQTEVASILLKHGANTHSEAHGHTPQSLAEGQGHSDLAALLKS